MSDDVPELAVSELFTSLQGEGPNAGRPTVFLRLMGCNLRCSWCDTPYTWDASRFDLKGQTTKFPLPLLARKLDELLQHTPRLDITGGEPLLQQDKLITLLHSLRTRPEIEVETNGTIRPVADMAMRVHRFNVSPKLSNANNAAEVIKVDVLQGYGYIANAYDQALLKFVVESPTDLDEVEQIVKVAQIEPSRVWLMPQGNTVAEVQPLLPWLADAALARGYNLSSRLHVYAFNDARGR